MKKECHCLYERNNTNTEQHRKLYIYFFPFNIYIKSLLRVILFCNNSHSSVLVQPINKRFINLTILIMKQNKTVSTKLSWVINYNNVSMPVNLLPIIHNQLYRQNSFKVCWLSPLYDPLSINKIYTSPDKQVS